MLDEVMRGPYQIPILLGVISIPFSLGINLTFPSSSIEVLPLFVASLVAGYIYQPQGVQAGTVTALSGGVPILVWQTGVVVADWWGNPILVDAVGDSWSMGLASIGAGVVTIGVATVVLVVIGAVGGGAGEWLHSQFGSSRQRRAEA